MKIDDIPGAAWASAYRNVRRMLRHDRLEALAHNGDDPTAPEARRIEERMRMLERLRDQARTIAEREVQP